MAVTAEQVASWLDRYVKAWQSNDPDEIGALFAHDATYAYNPWREPLRGRQAIIASWLEEPDEPGSFIAHYEPLITEGVEAVATGQSRYLGPDGSLVREFYNCFVLRFDGEGRCTSFTEWFMERPAVPHD